MTRRAFLRTFLVTTAAVAAGLVSVKRLFAAHRVVWAKASKRYPGKLRPLRNINQPGKWKG